MLPDGFAPDLAGKYWDLANYTTAFAIAQMLATLFASDKLHQGLKKEWKCPIVFVMVTFNAIYLLAVFWCYLVERQIRLQYNQADAAGLIWQAMVGREIAIFMFAVLGIVVFLNLKPEKRVGVMKR